MTGSPKRGSRLRPVLLSALVFPGLGQLASRRPAQAVAFAGASVLLLALLVRRVVAETARLMPVDPEALLDPVLPFRLAFEIQRQNASFFLWLTLGVVAVWALSVLDAWLAGPRGR